MTTIRMRSGVMYDLLEPRPEQIVLADICFALSWINRFTGNVGLNTVAEHSLRVSYLVPPELAAQGLGHDMAEAVIGDASSPMKRAMREVSRRADRQSPFDYLEEKQWKVFAARFGLPTRLSPEVKVADLQSLAFEKQRAWPGGGYAMPKDLPPPDLSRMPAALLMDPLPPAVAEQMMLKRAAELGFT